MPTNVKEYVKRNINITDDPPNPSSQTPNNRRAYAQGLKIPTSSIKQSIGYSNGQSSRSNTPVRGRSTNATQPTRFTGTSTHVHRQVEYLAPEPEAQTLGAHEDRGLLDTDLDSDFDKTMTSGISTRLGYDDGRRDEMEEGDDESDDLYAQDNEIDWDTFHQIADHHPQSYSNKTHAIEPSLIPAATSKHNNRQNGHVEQTNHQVEVNHQRIQSSRKRSHPDENAQQAKIEGRPEAIDVEVSDPEKHHGKMTATGQEDLVHSSANELPNNQGQIEVAPQPQVNTRSSASATQKQDEIAPSYSEEQMKQMSFSQVKETPWDRPDESIRFTLPDSLKDKPIGDQILYFVKDRSERGWDAQSAFYSSLNAKEWSDAGDFILTQFTDIFQQLKQAKLEKRNALEEIENEIERREEKVRGKSAQIDQTFQSMQAGGEGILRRKV